MPLLSQPWAVPTSQSTRVVALQGELSRGVAQSMLQGIFFLGPFALGSLFWEIVSALPGDVRTAADYARHGGRRKYQNGWLVSTRLLASLARIMALCFLSIYIAYTHGSKSIACDGWPRAIAAMSALALSSSVICFVLKAVGMARLNRIEMVLLAVLSIAQVIVPLVSVHSWSGGLTASNTACYLRIKTWFGIFSLLPLITLISVLTVLIFGHTNEKYRFSSIILQRASQLSPRRRTASTTSNPAPAVHAAAGESYDRTQVDKGPTLIPRLGERDQESDPSQASALNIEQSFLRLSGEDGASLDGRSGERQQRVMVFFLRYGSLWTFCFLTVLAGAIIGFMNPSPILTFVYQPILTTLPVLCASRLAHLSFGSSQQRPSSLPSVGSKNSQRRELNLTEKGISPQPFALRSSTSRPATASTHSGQHRAGDGSMIAVRMLLHQISGRSLRERYREKVAESDHGEQGSAMKNQISYPFTSEPPWEPRLPASISMSRAHSEDPSMTLVLSSDRHQSGLHSLRSTDSLAWTPRSLNVGLSPKPARRKLPSLVNNISDRSSAEQNDPRYSPSKVAQAILTPPMEQSESTSEQKGQKHRSLKLGQYSQDHLAPLSASEKPSNSWPTSTDSGGKDQMSTRRSSDLERNQEEEGIDLLKKVGEQEAQNERARDPQQRASFAEMSLDNPRDRSIDLSSLRGEQDLGDRAIFVSMEDRGVRPSRTREPSVKSVNVSIEDADEDELKQVLDARGFARPNSALSISKEEMFNRALSLRAAETTLTKAARVAAPSGCELKKAPISSKSKPMHDFVLGKGPAPETEASFGAAEISHNPRLEQLANPDDHRGMSPLWPYRAHTLTEEDRKESDQSGSSGPSQATTGVTGSSGSGSGGGSGSGVSRGVRVGFDHAARVGLGERGAAPSPIKQLYDPKKAKAKAKQAIEKGRQAHTTKGKAQNASDGGKSGDSGGTFGMKSSEIENGA